MEYFPKKLIQVYIIYFRMNRYSQIISYLCLKGGRVTRDLTLGSKHTNAICK